jgi:hypothetical protein
MSEANFTKQWDDETIFTEAQLDAFKSSIETFTNTGVIDSDNIQTAGLATANFSDASVVAAKIATGAITSGLLNSSINLPTAKFATGAVTKAKRPTQTVTTDGTDPGEGGVVYGAAQTASKSFAASTSLYANTDVTLTTSGRPVRIAFEGRLAYTGSPASDAEVEIYLDGGATGFAFGPNYSDDADVIEFNYLDTSVDGTASTYTWDIRLTSSDTNGGVDLTAGRLVAYEL